MSLLTAMPNARDAAIKAANDPRGALMDVRIAANDLRQRIMTEETEWVGKCPKCGNTDPPKNVYHSGNTYGYYPGLPRGHYNYCSQCGERIS